MKAIQNKDIYLAKMGNKHQSITELYDLADDLLASVESHFVSDQEAQLQLIEPLVNDIGDAADILSEEFIYIASSNNNSGGRKANKSRIENALRRVYNSLAVYHDKVKESARKTKGMLKNIADTVVRKIERHLEEIVVLFMEFVQISLSSIMHKQQLEAVKANNSKIALMMHHHAMMSQQ